MTFGEGISSSFISLIFNKEGLFFSSCMEAAKICLFDSLFVSISVSLFVSLFVSCSVFFSVFSLSLSGYSSLSSAEYMLDSSFVPDVSLIFEKPHPPSIHVVRIIESILFIVFFFINYPLSDI